MTAWLGDAGMVLFVPAAVVVLVDVSAVRWAARQRLAWRVNRAIDLEAWRTAKGRRHSTETPANHASREGVQKLSHSRNIVCKNV